MEKFRKQTKIKCFAAFAVALVGVAVVVLNALMLDKGGSFYSGFILGTRAGLGLLLLLLGVFFTIRCARALTNDVWLKQLYINSTDERKKYIQQKIGSTYRIAGFAALVLATIIASYFNQTVFITLYSVTLGHALILGVTKLFYNLKYTGG